MHLPGMLIAQRCEGTGLTHVDPRLVCMLGAWSERQLSTDENPYNWPKPAHMASSNLYSTLPMREWRMQIEKVGMKKRADLTEDAPCSGHRKKM